VRYAWTALLQLLPLLLLLVVVVVAVIVEVQLQTTIRVMISPSFIKKYYDAEHATFLRGNKITYAMPHICTTCTRTDRLAHGVLSSYSTAFKGYGAQQ
jgi:hypothetical protein